MSEQTVQMTEQLYDYYTSTFVKEDKDLKLLRDKTKQSFDVNWLINPEQGQFMMMLIQLINAKNILEIGVYTGYSTLCAAMSIPSHGKIIACDIGGPWIDVAQECWQNAGVANKISVVTGNANDTLKTIAKEHGENSFDFAFIDADKISYDNYYEHSLRLVKKGGIIAIDNIFLYGTIANTPNDEQATVMRQFNKKLGNDSRIKLSVIPIADGLALAQKL